MSNLTARITLDCEVTRGCGAIEFIVRPEEIDLGEFSVRRVLPTRERKMVGPWIFFDHMGPAEFQPGNGISVRPHPHINIATVTYLFAGEILHRDSLGSVQAIRPGDINLMVAGSGIVHSEREPAQVREVAHKLHGLQLWMALPQAQEEMDAAFYHYPAADIPTVTVEGVPLRVMIGSAYGVNSPVEVFADTLYVEAQLKAGQTLLLPGAEQRAVYVASGTLKARETVIPEYSMAIFDAQEGVVVEAVDEARIAIIGGEKMDPRYMEWNFVSSRKERIEQAKKEWKAGRFPKVPGDEVEFIPLPD